MIQFDKNTLDRWEENNIYTISLEFISAWCEWTELRVHENIILPEYEFVENSGKFVFYTQKQNLEQCKTLTITLVKGKWIVKSEAILSHCGCGKSFSLKTGDAKFDKIRLLKSKLTKKPKHEL